jgi:pyridoxamine 5'-phosphate oxidase
VINNLADLRKTYSKGSLSEKDALANPFEQFSIWFEQASKAQCPEPHAMSLATVNANGAPSLRTVLLKGLENNEFVFYTNYLSQKASEMKNNSQVALLFFWHELERQVRVDGIVQKAPTEMSDAYYYSRPLASRIGAWASSQSEIVPDREYLEAQERFYLDKFGDNPPRPEHWGGYIVVPHKIEFWQGRPSRLHDRIAYTKDGAKDGDQWVINRLAP